MMTGCRLIAAIAVGVWLTASNAHGGSLGVRTNSEVLWSETLRQQRAVIVSLPKSYASSTQTYPVIYLLDGEAHHAHVATMVQFMTDNDMMPEVIIVAVTNRVAERDRNLTPLSTVAEENKEGGGADQFLSFLRDELQPWVDRTYRTEPFRILIGHSFGGIFALHALTTRPEAFEAYLALDPSLWYSGGAMVDQVSAAMRKLPAGRSRYLHLSGRVGNQELDMFEARLAKKPPAHLVLRSRPAQAGETHNSLVHLSIYDGLKQLFDGWDFQPAMDLAVKEGRDPFVAVQAHYAALREKYSIRVQMSEKAYLWPAYHFLPSYGAWGVDPQHKPAHKDLARATGIMEELAGIYSEQRFLTLPVGLQEAGRTEEALGLLKDGLLYFSMRPDSSAEMMTVQYRIEKFLQRAEPPGAAN